MAMMPTSDPTERSMFRDTMTRTMPVAMTAMPDAWTARVTMLVGCEELAPAQDVEREEDRRQRDQHPEQAEIDLRRRDQSADRGARRRLRLTRSRVGHVRHGDPPDGR